MILTVTSLSTFPENTPPEALLLQQNSAHAQLRCVTANHCTLITLALPNGFLPKSTTGIQKKNEL